MRFGYFRQGFSRLVKMDPEAEASMNHRVTQETLVGCREKGRQMVREERYVSQEVGE